MGLAFAACKDTTFPQKSQGFPQKLSTVKVFHAIAMGWRRASRSSVFRPHLTGHPPLECLCLSQLGGEDQGVHTALIDNDDF